jgi:hypothetical protein
VVYLRPKGKLVSRRVLAVLAAASCAVALTGTPASAVSGGRPVPDPAAAPWMVTIAFAGDRPLLDRAACGGVLIRPDRVATAAHCLDHGDPARLDVHLGAATLSSQPGRTLTVRGFATHPGYRLIYPPDRPGDFSSAAAADDLGIIQLSRPVLGVRPMPVAGRAPAVGTPVQVYGHGQTGPTTTGDVLQRGDLRIIGDAACTASLGPVVDAASVVCAQSTATICAGDSGGPLVHRTPAGPQLVGLASFGGEVVGQTCGQDGAPGGFADAAAQRRWLDQDHPTLAPMNVGEPTIVGTRATGATLTCRPPTWSGRTPDNIEYQWDTDQVGSDGFDTFVPIDDATAPALTLSAELAAHPALCVITATTAGGTVELYSAPQ